MSDAAEQSELERVSSKLVGYFKLAVLAQYRAEPHKYELRVSDYGGVVKLTDAYWESLNDSQSEAESIDLRYGFRQDRNGELHIAAFLPDLVRKSPGHVARWAPYEVPASEMMPLPDAKYEPWAMRILMGSWEVGANAMERIDRTVRGINALAMEAFAEPLFKDESNPHLHAPTAENTHAYEDAHREAYAYLVDGLNANVVSALVKRTGAATGKEDRYTLQRLKKCFPSATTLYGALDVVSEQRRKAAHGVRQPATSMLAFDQFRQDMEAVATGLSELQSGLETLFSTSAEDAMKRQSALNSVPEAEGSAQISALTYAMPLLRQSVGRTVKSVELFQRRNEPRVHQSEVIKVTFTDGGVLYIEACTNIRNISAMHGDFDPQELDVSLCPHFVPPPPST